MKFILSTIQKLSFHESKPFCCLSEELINKLYQYILSFFKKVVYTFNLYLPLIVKYVIVT